MHFVIFGGSDPAIGYYQGKVRESDHHLTLVSIGP